MIDFKTTKPGDKLRIVGAGAPGYAELGAIVTSCNGTNRCDVVNEAGDTAYFALTCGAARLELVADDPGDTPNDDEWLDLGSDFGTGNE